MDVQATLLTERIRAVEPDYGDEADCVIIEISQVLVKRKVAVKKGPLAVVRLL